MAETKRIDAADNVALNGTWINGEKVSWSKAFPRPEHAKAQPCRDCGQKFPYHPEQDRCGACVHASMREAA